MSLAFNVEGRLGLNIANFQSKLAKAHSDVNSTSAKMKKATSKIKKSFDKVTKAITPLRAALAGLSVGAAVTGFVTLTSNALESARAIKDLADTTGSTTREVQGLTVAFSQLGLEQDDVGDVLNTLADRSKDAIDGMQSFVDDFKLIGIEVDSLKGKRPAELFELLADSVQKTEDPIKRQAAIVRLLGDDLGRKLAPALLNGAEGFREILREAEASGAIMSTATVEGAARASKAMDGLKTLIQGGVNTAFAQLGPYIELAANKLKAFLDLGGQSQASIVPAFETILKAGARVADVFHGLKVVGTGLVVAFKTVEVGVTTVFAAITNAMRAFANAVVTNITRPMRTVLAGLALFSDDAKKALATLDGFTIDMPVVSMMQIDEARIGLLTAIDEMQAAASETMPSQLMDTFIAQVAVAKAELEKTANTAEQTRVGAASTATGDSTKDDKFTKDLEAKEKRIDEFGQKVQRTLGTELENVLEGNFANIGDAFKSMLTKMAAEALAANITKSLGFGSAGTAGDTGGIASFFGGFFANGGRPPVGVPSIVGERGKEVFIPDQPGTIVPNNKISQMGGGQQIVNNNFVINTPNPEAFRSAQGRISARIAQAARG